MIGLGLTCLWLFVVSCAVVVLWTLGQNVTDTRDRLWLLGMFGIALLGGLGLALALTGLAHEMRRTRRAVLRR